jgi:hypothetical protein
MSAAALLAPPAGCTFDAARHEYHIDGVLTPSVTQVLSAEQFVDFSSVPGPILAEAQARGTYVHQVLHYLLEDDYDLADCEARFRGYVESALQYIEALGKRPLRDPDSGAAQAVEWRFWHRRRMFAGTIDWLGWDRDEVLSIDDWKTGEPSDVAAPLQTAAYEAGVRDVLLPVLLPDYRGPIRRRAVKLFRDGRRGRPDPYTDPRDLPQFYAALSCVHYRRNGMRHDRPAA